MKKPHPQLGYLTGVPKWANEEGDKPNPWAAFYWSSSDGEGNTSYCHWVRPMDIRAWEKLSSIMRPFV